MNCDFHSLCTWVCETSGVRPPCVVHEEDGTVTCRAVVQGYLATLVHAPRQGGRHALIRLDMGPLPCGAGHEQWKALLQANLVAFGRPSARLGLGHDEHVVMESVYPLAAASGPELYRQLWLLAESADQWRAVMHA